MRAARPPMSAVSAAGAGGTAEGLGNGRTGQEMDPSCGRRSRNQEAERWRVARCRPVAGLSPACRRRGALRKQRCGARRGLLTFYLVFHFISSATHEMLRRRQMVPLTCPILTVSA